MGFLTRATRASTGSLSSGAAAGPIHRMNEYAGAGLMIDSTGAISSAVGFSVGAVSTTLYPLFDSSNTVVTMSISTAVKQAYDLPAALFVWNYVQITSTGGSTGFSYTLMKKG